MKQFPLSASIRLGRVDEFDRIRRFYHEVTDGLQGAKFVIPWVKDIYPAPDDIASALERGDLFLGEVSDSYASAMVLNFLANESYDTVHWDSGIPQEECMVLHMLGVHPRFQRRGLAGQMIEEAKVIGRREGARAIRLDVLKGNTPAERLYPKHGFRLVEEAILYYEDTGWTDYLMYELLL